MPQVLAVTPETLAELRSRAENKRGLCLFEHTMHRSDEAPDRAIVFWLTCDTPEPTTLASMTVPATSAEDPTAAIQRFVQHTFTAHERDVAASVVLALVDMLPS